MQEAEINRDGKSITIKQRFKEFLKQARLNARDGSVSFFKYAVDTVRILPFSASPITAFTLIAAPAVLTNAVAVLVLSTSNRFSRTLDRARTLAVQIDSAELSQKQRRLRFSQFDRAQVRSFLLLRALSSFYLALATLAVTSVISIIGVTAGAVIPADFADAGPWIAAWTGGIGVATLAVGCFYLVKETRLAVESITEEAEHLRTRFRNHDMGSNV